MTKPGHSIAFTRDNHLGQLEDGIVGRRKTSVGGKLIKLCVFEVALHDRAEIVKFFVAGLMRFHALVFQ